MKHARWLLCCIFMVGLLGCSSLSQFINPPNVSITRVEMLPLQDFQPRFAVYLNVVNPNPIAIPVTGIAYQISLNGHSVFNGATSDVPTIPSYEEISMRLEVGTDLVESFAFVSSLIDGQFNRLEYQIDSDINVRGFARPFQVTEVGEVDFGSE